MIRTVAVTGIVVVALGMGLSSGVSAQTSVQGQAVGLLFLLGASTPGGQVSGKTQKPKPGIAASPKTETRIADVKQKLPGGGPTASIVHRVARPSGRLDSTMLRVPSDETNGPKLDRAVELTDREHAKHH